ncbi:DUF1579 domain-containing protein [Roseimaritima sediminicola]|uniref:DUF1579 domain-containing protein n=1 Tax=Roseimaritima sediminicola TaxID=2662066 RepID=UPI0012984A45|nr:DUF1579 domain-containing protein [Roseimaritima sediminicola]
MYAKPQSQHQWLDQLLGEWDFEHRCKLPDGSEPVTTGQMRCRSLGGLWLIAESDGKTEDQPWSAIMTLGFDPAKDAFVGTFVASMMANIWHYHGKLDADGKRLPLDSEGPKFDGSGTCRYRDTIEVVDADQWLMSSELLDENDQWQRFMTARHTRR